MATTPSPTPQVTETLARLRVRSAMQLGLFYCGADDDIATVARTMAEQRVHSVVVAGITRRDHAGEHLAWGIVSDMDLMRALESGADVTAGEVAATEIVVVSPRDSLAQAVQLMTAHETAHLVVASPETGRPVGMLSSLDIATAVDAA
jgi:CBS domain-containing protein